MKWIRFYYDPIIFVYEVVSTNASGKKFKKYINKTRAQNYIKTLLGRGYLFERGHSLDPMVRDRLYEAEETV